MPLLLLLIKQKREFQTTTAHLLNILHSPLHSSPENMKMVVIRLYESLLLCTRKVIRRGNKERPKRERIKQWHPRIMNIWPGFCLLGSTERSKLSASCLLSADRRRGRFFSSLIFGWCSCLVTGRMFGG